MGDYATAIGRPALVISHPWSLGVEEKFYLLWPFTVALLLRLPRKNTQVLIATMLIAITMWRVYSIDTLNHFWHTYFRFDTHCSALLLGALAAFTTVKPRPIVGWLGRPGVVLTFFTWKTRASAIFGISLTEIFSLMIITNSPIFLGWGVLRWLGKMSYGFYLWHYLLIKIGIAHEFG